MLKNKEKRDTFLLIFMAIIFILFLVYLFIPFGENDNQKVKTNTNEKNDTNAVISQTSKSWDKTKEYLTDLNEKISLELVNIYNKTKESDNAFFDYDIKAIKQVFAEVGEPAEDKKEGVLFVKKLKKITHLGFYDLADMVNYDYPQDTDKTLIFNMYLSFYLIKAREENIAEDVGDLSDVVFEKVVNLDAYRLLSQEIEQDYQAFPILFYFKLILERYNLYPVGDDFLFFRDKLDPIQDLSENKVAMKIKDLINFSQTHERYRIEWTEKDGLVDPDDKRVYNNIALRTIHFLKQIYLVFPDYKNDNSNRWIKELLLADSGNIELIGLQISSEDPSKNLQIQKIFYMPQKSQFIVLLKGNNSRVEDNFLERIVFQRMNDFHQNFLSVDFELRFINQKSFKKELDNFGIYLKKQVVVK